jgi:hypothetical protein
MWEESFENAITNFSDELGGMVPSLTKGICFGITDDGDGISLDRDYKWEIVEDDDGGGQTLVILDW